MAPIPPPSMSNFYNVVCNGTWLNREQYNQAQADYRGNSRAETQKQDADNWMQWVFTQSPTATVKANPFTLPTTVLPNNALGVPEPSLNNFLTFLFTPNSTQAINALFRSGVQQQQAKTAQALGLMGTFMQALQQNQSFLGTLNALFFGKKEARGEGGVKEKDEAKVWQDSFFSQHVAPELFSTTKVAGTTGTTLGGGGG